MQIHTHCTEFQVWKVNVGRGAQSVSLDIECRDCGWYVHTANLPKLTGATQDAVDRLEATIGMAVKAGFNAKI